MKLEQLIQRERFDSIFISTLTNYFSKTTKWKGSISWGHHGGKEDLNLIANSKLNIIYPINLPKSELLPIVSEYSYHTNPLRHLLHKIYIAITLDPIFRKFFSRIKIKITNKSTLPNNFCILPGNHSIRIINLDLDQCVVLLKEGYDKNKINNSLSIRSAFIDLPGPKIINSSPIEGWYTEERIRGLPIDRVLNIKRANKSLSATKDFLAKLYKETLQSEVSLNFLRDKFHAIDKAISSLPDCFLESDLQELKDLKLTLVEISKSLFNEIELVEVSQTHGDLQAANILIPFQDSSREVYIIDWEYSDIRCLHYDWFVYGLKSRSPDGLSKRIISLVNSDEYTLSKIDWYDFSGISIHKVKAMIILFLVEEFLFRLDDTNLPNLFVKPKGFTIFLFEAKLFLDQFIVKH